MAAQLEIGVQAAQIGTSGRPAVEPGAFLGLGLQGLRLNSWNSLTGVTLRYVMRFLDLDGRITTNTYTHTPNTNRTKATTDVALAPGFPLSIMVFAASAAPLIGQTFVQVQLIQGTGGGAVPIATLLASYVTAVQTVAWPGSEVISSIEGGGVLRTIDGTQPAAGAEISETVPTGARWELLSFVCTFTADATGGNRRLTLIGQGGAINKWQSDASSVVAAGAGMVGIWAQGMPHTTAIVASNPIAGIPFSAQFLAGERFRTNAAGIGAADQYSAPTSTVREWLEAAA